MRRFGNRPRGFVPRGQFDMLIFYLKLGGKILLSTAKMMTIATPPVTTVVTMPLIAVRSASLEMRATAMGFHTQVNRLMTRKTAPLT